MVEPLLWRPFGWCRLEVDVAGQAAAKGEGARPARPAARRAAGRDRAPLADELLDRLVPDRPRDARAAAGAGALEEPAALPEARLGPDGDVRR